MILNKIRLGFITLLFSPIMVHAQSVTLYGLIDTSVRFVTNAKASNGTPGNQLSLTQGALSGSRWGFRGSEDLGDGAKAIFDLEAGFLVNNGTIDQQGQLFGRQAWAGISHPVYGRLLAGRVYGVAFGLMSDFDVLGLGNYLENAYLPRIVGTRYDNTIDYTIARGPFSLELQYGVGGQPGSLSIGSTKAAGLDFQQSGLELGAVAQQSKDAMGHNADILGAGGNYKIGAATLFAMYVNAKRDAGFSVGTTTGDPLANTSLIGNANTVLGNGTQTARRTDSYASLGAQYQFTPFLSTSLGLMIDNVAHVVNQQDGKIRTAYLMVNYSLSKLTGVYAQVDRTLLSGASVTDPNNPPLTYAGKSTRTGVGVGLRTRF